MSPTFTALFAAVPRTAWNGTSTAERRRVRLFRSDKFVSLANPFKIAADPGQSSNSRA